MSGGDKIRGDNIYYDTGLKYMPNRTFQKEIYDGGTSIYSYTVISCHHIIDITNLGQLTQVCVSWTIVTVSRLGSSHL